MSADHEFEEHVAQAFKSLQEQVKALQVVQQIAAMKHQMEDTQCASETADILKKLVNSNLTEASDFVKEYVSNMSRHYKGDLDAPIYGLTSAPSTGTANWFQGVIDGGKKDNS